MFAYLKDRVWKRIPGWKEKLLSKAGKEVLIKVVAQAIPSYAMSCFDLTKSLCDEISSMICRYWWAQQENEKKLHWLSWQKLTSRKEKGGLGYRDLHLFNLASLCARLLRAKYWPDGNIMEAKEGPGISYTYRSMLCRLRAMENGIIWRIENGQNVRIWEDPWIPAGITRRPRTPRGSILLSKVSELIDPHTGLWDEQLINKDLFWEEDVANILVMPVQCDRDDFVAWHFDPKGMFSVKSAYHILEDREEMLMTRQTGESSAARNNNEGSNIWKRIWRLPATPKIKQFLWRVAHNSLAFKLNIRRRGILLDTRCPVCFRYDEDGRHCFLKCKPARHCWRELQLEAERASLLEAVSSEDFFQGAEYEA